MATKSPLLARIAPKSAGVSTRIVGGGLVLAGTIVAPATEAHCKQAMKMGYAGALVAQGGLALTGEALQLVLWSPRLLSGEALTKLTESFTQDLESWRGALVSAMGQAVLEEENKRATVEHRESRIRQKIMRV
jgi:hypothetical protein